MRLMAFTAPLLFLVYGGLRWFDGLDGHRKDGLSWDLGHLAFLAGVLVFAALAVALSRRATIGRTIAKVAAVCTLAGAAAFIWVILDDLSVDVGTIPGVVTALGPALFTLGLIALYSLEVAADRLPIWSPILVFSAFAMITLNLDLLPPAAVLLIVASAPVGAPVRAPVEHRAA
jgi:hypothetical protein